MEHETLIFIYSAHLFLYIGLLRLLWQTMCPETLSSVPGTVDTFIKVDIRFTRAIDLPEHQTH